MNYNDIPIKALLFAHISVLFAVPMPKITSKHLKGEL